MLVPKTDVALEEALEEGCGFALTRVLESEDVRNREFKPPYPGLSDHLRARLIDRMVYEVKCALYERFEVSYPADTQTIADTLYYAGIRCRSLLGRFITRYLKKRGGLVDSRGGFEESEE